MLTDEKKRQAFQKLRTENYRASLRLEGMVRQKAGSSQPAQPMAVRKTKHVR